MFYLYYVFLCGFRVFIPGAAIGEVAATEVDDVVVVVVDGLVSGFLNI